MFKIINKIKNMNEEDRNFNLIFIILSIFSLTYVAQKGAEHGMKFILILALSTIIFEAGIYFLLKYCFKKKLPLHKIYLIFAIILGVFYIFGFPPSQLPDDTPDYLRSLEVSQLHATSVMKGKTVGRNMPTNIKKIYESKNYEDVIKNSKIKLNKEKDFIPFANKALYAFFCYIPQAIGVGVGAILGLPIIIQIILGKVLNYMLFVLLLYYSIKYIPSKKMLLFFIALLPITMQEAASLSPDAMTISSAIALVSFILWTRKEKNEKLKNKHLIILAVLTTALSLCKIVYLPLCFLIFLIPDECFNSKKQKYLYCILLSIFVVFINLIWLNISSEYLVAFSKRSNSKEQLKYILSNPIRYLIIITTTLDAYLLHYLEQMVGHSLGAFVVSTSYVIVILSLGILAYLIGQKNKDKNIKDIFNFLEKCFIFVLVLGTVGLMFTSLYMQWTGVGAQVVDGIQGRYFIPLLLPIALLFMNNTNEDKFNKNIVAFSLIGNVMAIIAIFTTFI